MSSLSPTGAPVDVLLAQGRGAPGLNRANIKETAQAFEASFLSIMFNEMFKDVEQSAPFGGGQGEQMFKSFFSDAVAKQVARAGGIGLASTVEREMLKMQGLSEEPVHGA